MALGRGVSVLLLVVLWLALSQTDASGDTFNRCTRRQLEPNIYGDGKSQQAIYECTSYAIRQILATKRTTELVNPTNPADPVNAYFRFEGILLRMAFHDAGTWDCETEEGGANGSLRFPEEKGHRANLGMRNGVDALVAEWEAMKAAGCGVTFADLIQIAGAEACFYTGLPRFDVPIGRKDATGPDLSTIEVLPRSNMNINELKRLFGGNGYNLRDLVSLSGGHTIGFSRVTNKTGFMDGTPDTFDNVYYENLVKDGCLMDDVTGNNFCSDSTLLDDLDSASLVLTYRTFPEVWYRDFISGYIKMGMMGVNGRGTVAPY